ncbi:NAD(P)H-binding protein [Suttonella ornithocola]|uniref:Semialdehyde dehydrogenase, NAD binding domain n=1 Tax=Suttonella ornithocola TaxID=279832 RepID=A0A380MPY7_9GAMM|nr:NAD(P)H-binding protein [Suttonella ornithocola]SUO93963.1 Semialdehyde dehydrogenase, NAD binding domain [Suttonella ornithocola]
MKTALIVGATGVVGKELVAQLAEHPDYEKIILWVRRELAPINDKVSVQQVDFSALPVQLPKVDEVFCALGTTIKKAGSQANFLQVDVVLPTEIARLAQVAGVARFVVISALGANPQAKVFYSRAKGQLEEHLKALNFASLQIVRPALIVGERADKRRAEQFFIWLFNHLPKNWLRAYRPMSGAEIARIMIEQAQRPLNGVEIYSPQRLALGEEKC